MIHRLVRGSDIDASLAQGQTRANWYSIRHTFADFLSGHVSDHAISAVMGHTSITMSDRDRLFGRGSPVTEIYKRRSLKPVLDVGEVLATKWWPEIIGRSEL